MVLILALCWIFRLEMRALQSFAIFATSSPLQRSWHLLENAFILQQPLEYPTFQIIYKDLLLRQQRRNISFIMSLIMRFYKNVENTVTSVNRMTSYLSSYLEWVTLQDFKNIAYVGRFRYFVCVFVVIFVLVFVVSYDFYRTRMLVTNWLPNWLTHSLTHSLPFSQLESDLTHWLTFLS